MGEAGENVDQGGAARDTRAEAWRIASVEDTPYGLGIVMRRERPKWRDYLGCAALCLVLVVGTAFFPFVEGRAITTGLLVAAASAGLKAWELLRRKVGRLVLSVDALTLTRRSETWGIGRTRSFRLNRISNLRALGEGTKEKTKQRWWLRPIGRMFRRMSDEEWDAYAQRHYPEDLPAVVFDYEGKTRHLVWPVTWDTAERIVAEILRRVDIPNTAQSALSAPKG